MPDTLAVLRASLTASVSLMVVQSNVLTDPQLQAEGRALTERYIRLHRLSD